MYYHARCVSRTTEWTTLRTNRRLGSRLDQSAGSREVRYVNYRPTYVSLSRSTTSHIPVPSLLSVGYLGCQPIRLGTAPIAGLVARRARVRPTSRPYDPNAGQRSFCPLSISLRKQHGEPLTLASDRGFNCSSSVVLLTTSFAPPPLLVWFLASRAHPIDRSGIHDVGRCVGNELWERSQAQVARSV